MRFLILALILLFTVTNAQTYYRKLPEQKIDSERLETAKKMFKETAEKCLNLDYSLHQTVVLSKRLEFFFEKNFKNSCEKNLEKFGKTEIIKLNSAYTLKYLENIDPIDLFIFEIKNEKMPDVKYLHIWIYHDKNIVGGYSFSNEKKLKPKPEKISLTD